MKVLVFLGFISYSLYLLHVPIGGRVINLAGRLPHTMPVELGAETAAMAVSLIAAWLLYRLVERPSQKWVRALPLSWQYGWERGARRSRCAPSRAYAAWRLRDGVGAGSASSSGSATGSKRSSCLR